MPLRITTTPAQLGIIRHDALLSIRQPKAEMEISTVKPEVNINFDHVRVFIDQSQCFSEAGLKNVFELTRENAMLGRQAALEGIASFVDEGNSLAMIHNKADAVVEIAAAKTFPPPADFNITFIPQSRPKIEFEGGLSFDPRPGRVDLEVTIRPPEISATRPELKFYLIQKPELRIELVGSNLDLKA